MLVDISSADGLWSEMTHTKRMRHVSISMADLFVIYLMIGSVAISRWDLWVGATSVVVFINRMNRCRGARDRFRKTAVDVRQRVVGRKATATVAALKAEEDIHLPGSTRYIRL
jgi:hypothetical protein